MEFTNAQKQTLDLFSIACRDLCLPEGEAIDLIQGVIDFYDFLNDVTVPLLVN